MSRAVPSSPPMMWSPSRGLARAQHTLGSQTTEVPIVRSKLYSFKAPLGGQVPVSKKYMYFLLISFLKYRGRETY